MYFIVTSPKLPFKIAVKGSLSDSLFWGLFARAENWNWTFKKKCKNPRSHVGCFLTYSERLKAYFDILFLYHAWKKERIRNLK